MLDMPDIDICNPVRRFHLSEVPARVVVPPPGLRIALNAGTARAGDAELPLLGSVAALLMKGGARPAVRSGWRGRARSSGVCSPKPAQTASSFVESEFVVVVPGRIEPDFEHMLTQSSPPPIDAGTAGEVDMGALAIPELRNCGSAVPLRG